MLLVHDPPPDVDGADALGPVHLVAADGHEVDLEIIHTHGDLADRLGTVGVEEHALAAAHLSNLLHRLDDTCLQAESAVAMGSGEHEEAKRKHALTAARLPNLSQVG